MPGKKRDYYQILGVPKGTGVYKINKALRKAALKWHPDRFKTDEEKKKAEEQFKEIGEAYAVLSDPEKKQLYDQFGQAAFDPRSGAGPGGIRYTTFDFGDASKIFEEFFGGNFSSIFGGRGGRKRGRRAQPSFGGSDFFGFGNSFGQRSQGGSDPFQSAQQPPKGQDVRISLKISFEESMRGIEKKVRLSSGGDAPRSVINLKIPPGVSDGTKLKIPGQGKPGPAGMPPGDLVVDVLVESHPILRRDGDNLIYDAKVSLATALLGGEVQVPTWDGKQAKIKIPAGTQSETRLRLAGKGVPGRNTSSPGDLVINIQILMPKSLTERQRTLIREFEDIERSKH